MNLQCVYQNQCSGCSWIDKNLASQKAAKLEALSSLTSEVEWLGVGDRGLRDRVDLTWLRGEGLGLYHLTERKIVDIEECLMMSPELHSWFKEFRKLPIPIVNKGSLRLRVGLNNLRGVWLDFANVDVKALLDEKTYLEKLMSMGHVEIGQRKKVLGHKDGQLKLLEPQHNPWFSTLVNEKTLPLKCSIADFTQPSLKANKVLVEAVMTEFKDKKIKVAIEFGAGIGNFTLPLAAICEKIYSLEVDPYFAEVLAENLGELKSKVEILRGDYQNPNEKRQLIFKDVDAVLVDPPRSGLKNFLVPLEASEAKPKYFIYVSCYPESFAIDKQRLEAIGYKMQKLKLVDQFPNTPHTELVAVFSCV